MWHRKSSGEVDGEDTLSRGTVEEYSVVRRTEGLVGVEAEESHLEGFACDDCLRDFAAPRACQSARFGEERTIKYVTCNVEGIGEVNIAAG